MEPRGWSLVPAPAQVLNKSPQSVRLFFCRVLPFLYKSDLSFVWEEIDERSDLSNLFPKGLFSYSGIRIESPADLPAFIETSQTLKYESTSGGRNQYRLFKEALPGITDPGTELYKNTSARVLEGTVSDDRLYFINTKDSFSANTNAFILIDFIFEGFTVQMTLSDGNRARGTVNGITYPGAWYYGVNGILRGVDEKKISEGGKAYSYNPGGLPSSPNENVYYDTDGYLDIYFTRNQYDLIFETNNGPAVPSSTLYYEENLSNYIPAEYIAGVTKKTTADGHEMTFAGWYAEPSFTIPFDFSSTMPAFNVHVYAKWEPNKYSVIFDSNGGSEGKAPVDSNLYAGSADAKVMAPGNITAPEDKCFICWTKKDSDKEYYPGDMVELDGQDVTLYAKWDDIPKPTQLIYDFNFERFGITGVSAGIRTQKVGAAPSGDHTIVTGIVNNGKVTLAGINEVLGKTVSGYRFVGWHLAADCSDDIVTSLRVDSLNEESNVVYAEWEKLPETGSPGTQADEPDDPLRPDKRLTPNDPATPNSSGKIVKSGSGDAAVKNLSPATSDDSNISFCLIVFFLSAIALAATALSTVPGGMANNSKR